MAGHIKCSKNVTFEDFPQMEQSIILFYKITEIVRVIWLVKNLWFIIR